MQDMARVFHAMPEAGGNWLSDVVRQRLAVTGQVWMQSLLPQTSKAQSYMTGQREYSRRALVVYTLAEQIIRTHDPVEMQLNPLRTSARE